jgi:hypothetical protein
LTALRARRILPGLWLGLLVCIAAIVAPACFAVLPSADAGRVLARIFVQEAWLSLSFAVALWLLEGVHARRLQHAASRGPSRHTLLLIGTLVCTLLGYFAVQRAMPAARLGQGMLSFGQLHLVSTVCYAVKIVLACVLAWRVAAPYPSLSPRPSS